MKKAPKNRKMVYRAAIASVNDVGMAIKLGFAWFVIYSLMKMNHKRRIIQQNTVISFRKKERKRR